MNNPSRDPSSPIASFDAAAATWDEKPERARLNEAILEALDAEHLLRAGQRLLEVGCGTAALSLRLAERAAEVVAADASEGMLAEASRKARAVGRMNLRLTRLDIARDPLPAGPFDGVLCVMTLHHVEDAEGALRRMSGVVAERGFLAVADLVSEDGSFHGERSVPHHGFAPERLVEKLKAMGWPSAEWRGVHALRRGEREYPVFLLIARRPRRLKVLFLCTGNSCRSQMAEGWARTLRGDEVEAWSAGIEAHGLNPRAVKAMAEAGVDISGQRSKTVDDVRTEDFDVVITVCGHAHETCPAWLGGKAKVVHVGFDDPPTLARGAATEEEAMSHYRRVRDEIRRFVETLPGALTG